MSRKAGLGWAALVVVVLLATASTSSMVRAQPLADVVRYSPAGWEIAAGPDGRLWEVGGLRVGWLDDSGNLTQATGPGEQPASSGPLTPLTDGSMAFVAAFGRSASDYRLGVVHLHAGVTPAVNPVPIRLVRVPQQTALRADGTLMIDDLCRGRVIRVSPSGSVSHVRLARRPCTTGGGEAIAVGEDGTTWVVHACQGRIVRIPLIGKPREWSAPLPQYCAPDSPHYIPRALSIAPTPNGGLLTPDLRVSASGRLSIVKFDLPIARTRDGSIWTNAHGKLVQRDPRGKLRRWPWQAIAATVGPDGRLWYTRAHVEINPDVLLDPAVSGHYWTAWDVRVGAIDPRSGSVTEQALSPYGPDRSNSPILFAVPTMVPGPDDSVWLTEDRDDHGSFSPFLTRLTPERDLGSSQPTTAAATRIIGHAGHVLWLQLRCTGRPGLYCAGSTILIAGGLKLSGRSAAFSIPTGCSQPLRFRLTTRARRSLHPGMVVQARVRTATSTGAVVLNQRILQIPKP